jgi:hypothetical protein
MRKFLEREIELFGSLAITDLISPCPTYTMYAQDAFPSLG